MTELPDQRVEISPDEVDGSFVPQPVARLVSVPVGDELVVLDGWDLATCLNPTGALIWRCFDGRTSLDDIAGGLSEAHGVDPGIVLPDVVGLARRLGSEGLLGGVAPPAVDLGFELEPVLPAAVGDAVEDVGVWTLDGVPSRLGELLGRHREVLLVNWNPHCGYCARISEPLARVHASLDAAGIDLVLVATGSADANRGVADAAGLRATIVLLDEGADPFRDAGTPAAYHLGIDGLVASAPAYGCDEVPALAASLAGIELESGLEDEVRYLLERDGACAQGAAADGPQWAETRVYRLCDHHVGIRVDSEATGTVLDRLFSGQRVEDPRAGHSFCSRSRASGDPPLMGMVDRRRPEA